MEFRILGPVEVVGTGRPIRLGSRRERAVLAALVLGGGDVVSADRLIDALWGDSPPRSATKTLQNYVLKLRKALGSAAIETQAPGYRLVAEAAVIDARRFDALIRSAGEAAAAGHPEDAVGLLRDALDLWRGIPLEELEGWGAADAEANRLNELHRVATEQLVDAEIACGRAATVVAELEAMVIAEPLRERRWAMLMLALYRDGRQADALRAYQRARTLLGDELGIEPGPELRDLERAIAEQDPALDLSAPGIDSRAGADDELADDPDACPPYKGLAAFQPEDQALFFGRSVLVSELVERARRARFITVVGASGSGKSSVVRAGVLAALRDGALEGSRGWPSVVMTPGVRPLAELASSLAPTIDRNLSDVLDRLESDSAALTELARDVIRPGDRLVIVVDQLEELFTQTRDESERRQFVQVLVDAVASDDAPVTVLVALRADFYGHCSAFPQLAAMLDDGSTLLCPMEPDEIRAAVEGPAELAGLHVEPGLTELVVRDVGDEPGGLPLLSHALLETWKRRERRTLTVAGYQAAGGAQGAIAQTAESVYRQLGPSEQARARRIFLRLTELGEGTEDTGRRVDRGELDDVTDGPGGDGVLERLAGARLVTLDGRTTQLAHEALIREWPRLRTWLDEDREGRRLHRHLTHASRDWERLGREPTELYRGPRLAATTEWLAREGHAAELNALEAEFVRASTGLEAAERAAAAEQLRNRERSNRRLRKLLVATVIALVVALISGTLAFVQRERADNEAATARSASTAATSGRLVAESKSLQADNRYLGTLLALEADRITDDPQTRGAVFGAVLEEPRRVLTIPVPGSDAVLPLPDGTVLIHTRGRIEHWDVARGKRLGRFPGRDVTALAGSGSEIAVGRADGTIAFVDSSGRRSGPVIHTAEVRPSEKVPPWGPGSPVTHLAISPDGARIVASFGVTGDPRTVDGADSVRMYDAATGRVLPARFDGHSSTVTSVAFSPDGRRLLTGGNDDRVIVRDATTGAAMGAPLLANGNVWAVGFDPVRDRVAVSTLGVGVTVFDLSDGTRTDIGHGNEAGLSWNTDGSRLALGGNAPVQLYDAETLTPSGAAIDAQTGTATPRFLPDGRLIVAGRHGPVTVWNLDGQSVLARRVPDAPSYVFPMPGGKVVAVPDLADSVTLYDTRTLRRLGAVTPGAAPANFLDFPTTFAASYYHGDRIAVVNRAGTMQVFDVASRRPISEPYQLGFPTLYAVFSPDMRQVAVGGRLGEVALVDLKTRRVRLLESPLTSYIDGLAFTPRGDLAVADVGHAVLFRHLDQPKPTVDDLSRFVTTADAPAGMDVSPDGRTMAIASGGSVSFIDVATEHRVGSPARIGAGTISWIAFSRDGKTIVTADQNNLTRLVDVETRQIVGPALPAAPYTGPVFSRDSKILGTSTPAEGGALLSVDPAVWGREACRLAGRNLTVGEWAKYLPNQGPRQKTCSQFP